MDRKLALLQIIIQALCLSVQAQVSVTELFQNEKPLAISINFPFKDINKNTNDTIYFPSVLYYKNEKNVEDSIRVSLRAGEISEGNTAFLLL